MTFISSGGADEVDSVHVRALGAVLVRDRTGERFASSSALGSRIDVDDLVGGRSLDDRHHRRARRSSRTIVVQTSSATTSSRGHRGGLALTSTVAGAEQCGGSAATGSPLSAAPSP